MLGLYSHVAESDIFRAQSAGHLGYQSSYPSSQIDSPQSQCSVGPSCGHHNPLDDPIVDDNRPSIL